MLSRAVGDDGSRGTHDGLHPQRLGEGEAVAVGQPRALTTRCRISPNNEVPSTGLDVHSYLIPQSHKLGPWLPVVERLDAAPLRCDSRSPP